MIVYRARWVLPVSSPAIPGGAVAVEGGRITFVGRGDDAPSGESREFGDAVLLPGLVNVHTHIELTAMRGYLEGLGFRDWISRLTAARLEVMTPALTRASARAGIAEGLASGITTYADTGASGEVFEAMLEMGVRGIAYREAFGPDPARCDASLAELRAAVDDARTRETALVRVGVSPHAPYTVSDALFAAVAGFAIEHGLPVAVHVAESEAEDALVREGTGPFAEALRARGIAVASRGRSPIELLERCGVLAARPLLIHCVRASESDADRVRRYDCAIAHCPASNAKLGHGVAPLTDWIGRGLRVGLGSDSVASNNRMDLLDEARLGALMQRARLGSFAALPGAACLELATSGGARALGLEGRIGSLEVGKDADLAAFALDDVADAAVYGPEDALVFGAGGRRALLAVVQGRELVRDGHLVESVADDVRRVRAAAARLSAVGQP